MFCSSCGKQLAQSTRFCDGCGTPTGISAAGSVAAAPQPEAVAIPASTVVAKSFTCNGCGAPLQIPQNAKGTVVCSSCKNECVLEGVIKNAEMAAKENINSGVALSANQKKLHDKLVEALCSLKSAPLDIFNKVEVIREERYCVPAYCFYCNGTASYTYEIAKWTTHKTAVDRGNITQVEKEQIKDYTPMSGTAAVTATRFSSANREFAQQIESLYLNADPDLLVDYEYLSYPSDVTTCDSNLPQAASFNTYVKTNVEELLSRDAENGLAGKDYRSLQMGGSRIDKEETIRVFLGMYRIIYKYMGKEYSIWLTGDGERWCYDTAPVDQQRQQTIDAKSKEVENIPENKSNAWPVILIILGVIFAAATGGVALIATVLGIVFLIKNNKSNNQTTYVRSTAERELRELQAQWQGAIIQFNEDKKVLNGIYDTKKDSNK